MSDQPIIIDLEKAKKEQLNESFLHMFGAQVEFMLRRMFGHHIMPIEVRGQKSDIGALAKVLSKEKRYMDSFLKHGLASPRVTNSKYALEQAVRNFELETGIKWPVK